MTNQTKDERNTTFCFKKFQIFQQYLNCIHQPCIRFTYSEFLKQQYAKEFYKIKPNLLWIQKFYENKRILLQQAKASSNAAGDESELKIKDESFEQSNTDAMAKNQTKKRNIFKELFRTKPKEPVPSPDDDVDVDGFVWIEDPLEAKKNSFKWKIRKYFVQSAEQDQEKDKQKDGQDDYILDDFVAVKPEQKLDSKVSKETQNINKLEESLIDFTAGSLGGIAQVYVSQPLDTVKVKLQTYPKLYSNMFTCFMHTYRQSGVFRGLYAGTLPAVVASVAENSVLFTAYSGCQQLISFILEIDKICELSTFGNACAGCLAAFFSTFTLCPTELVKCKLQAVQEMKAYVTKDSKAPPITALNLTKHIYLTEGIRGFYRGLTSTFVREMPGVFFFFGSYEATREYLKESGQSKDDIGPLRTMCAGAVGGISLWTVTFPADVIKSRIQINNLKENMFTVGLQILRREGLFALYNGLLPSVLRTIPSTATLFLVYEYTKKNLSQMIIDRQQINN